MGHSLSSQPIYQSLFSLSWLSYDIWWAEHEVEHSQWISSWLSCIYLIFDEIFYLVFGNVALLINEIPFTWFGSPCHYVGLNVLGSIIHFLIYYYGWIIELTKTKRSLYIGKLDWVFGVLVKSQPNTQPNLLF